MDYFSMLNVLQQKIFCMFGVYATLFLKTYNQETYNHRESKNKHWNKTQTLAMLGLCRKISAGKSWRTTSLTNSHEVRTRLGLGLHSELMGSKTMCTVWTKYHRIPLLQLHVHYLANLVITSHRPQISHHNSIRQALILRGIGQATFSLGFIKIPGSTNATVRATSQNIKIENCQLIWISN